MSFKHNINTAIIYEMKLGKVAKGVSLDNNIGLQS
jgi:hypothetical protein